VLVLSSVCGLGLAASCFWLVSVWSDNLMWVLVSDSVLGVYQPLC
jgi:hypothetical protein